MVSINQTKKIAEFLSYSNELLVEFLWQILPEISINWWDETVVDKLGHSHQEKIKKNNITNLDGLDLAALLRIFDLNWYEISHKCNFVDEDRHFEKEMLSVSNRWANLPEDCYNTDDLYRDYDTAQRFLKLIKADPAHIEELQKMKKEISSKSAKNSAQFELTQIVVVKSDRSKRGPVMSVKSGNPEDTIEVFIDGKKVPYYASQLEPEESKTIQELRCDEFHAYLSALEIRFPGISSLFSLHAARIDFIPYQFKPVLRFNRAERPRMLIADSVGVGKTIEAGLILRELQARKEVQSVLIICPRPLVVEKKWYNEMRRFDEDFCHLDGKLLRFCINETNKEGWPERYKKAIIPYSLLKEDIVEGTKKYPGLNKLDPPPRFDLVIVDEAHHVRNDYTWRYAAVKYFCENSEAVLFLTATPIQLGTNDLYTLLNLLRPDIITHPESFNHRAEPNPYINAAISAMRENNNDWKDNALENLNKAAETSWGKNFLKTNPEFDQIKSELNTGSISKEKRVKLLSSVEDLHTFSGIVNRTRRRDIGDFTKRNPQTVKIQFSLQQRHLHDTLLRIQAEIFKNIHGDKSVAFMMCTIRRQAASCIFGLKPYLREILKRHLDELLWDEYDLDDEDIDTSFIENIEAEINSLLVAANTLEDNDPKYDALMKIILEKHELLNNRIMIYSSFRHTLYYLNEKLKKDKLRVGLIHGGVPNDERVELRKKFEMDRSENDAIDILLFSEVGCEGLDYQFCDCMINYDLPWNPMRIEQRIGRIDRHGQKSPTVAIYNMITPGTIDADIYERCLSRIGVFESSIGDCEEILGEITSELMNIASDFTLDEKGRQEKLQQLADNKIRYIQETEKLEKEKFNFIGLKIPQEQLNKEIESASSYWLSQKSLLRLVNLYLQRRIEKNQEFILGDKSIKTLRLSVEARTLLLIDYRQITPVRNVMYSKWENWLKGGEPNLKITFDSETAVNEPAIAFIMPLHPLVKQAAEFFKLDSRAYTKMYVVSNLLPQSDYCFSVYYWKLNGIKKDQCLKIIAETDNIACHIEQLLKEAIDNETVKYSDLSEKAWKTLDDRHYEIWQEAKNEHYEKNKLIIQYQYESLSISHKARMKLLSEHLNAASNEKIRTMRRREIDNAAADYSRRIQDLELSIAKADIEFEPVAYGIITVRNE